MVKKNILFLLFFILLTACLFLIAGCLEKKECEVSSDCPTKECRTVPQCIEEKCVYNIIPNCCGNTKCEENVGENKCTCPSDCGKCEGGKKYKEPGTTKEKETQYLIYTCIYDECVLDSKRKAESFFTEKTLAYFKLGITSSLEQPFDVYKSSFTVRIELENVDDDLVPPVKFTKIMVLDKQKHPLGEKEIMQELDEVGDSFEEELNLVSGTSLLEETKYTVLRVSYEYSVLEPTGERDEEGNRIYAPSAPKPESFEYQFTEKLVFVNPRAK